jgi:hypothetical protein
LVGAAGQLRGDARIFELLIFESVIFGLLIFESVIFGLLMFGFLAEFHGVLPRTELLTPDGCLQPTGK